MSKGSEHWNRTTEKRTLGAVDIGVRGQRKENGRQETGHVSRVQRMGNKAQSHETG
jgi:hypothetical protein